MLCAKKIDYDNKEDMGKAIDLYLSAFPEIERRSLEEIDSLWKKNGACTFHGIYKDDEFTGFFSIWNCEFFYFLEYVAIKKENRGKGLASTIFTTLLHSTYAPIICEVEIPELVQDSIMARRRISFYKRLGWDLLDIKYLLPPLKEGDIEFPFYLMSYGKMPKSLPEVVKKLYRTAYALKKE